MRIKNYILILTFIFSINLIYADSNGIWNLAEDLRGGIIGADEQTPGMNYTFVNNVYFGEKILSLLNPFSYFIDIDGRTQLNDLASNSFNTNKASINGNLNVKNNLNLSGDLKLIKIGNCPGRLYTNSNGDVLCGVDNVNDADNDSTNELQKLSRSGTTVTLSNGGGSVSIADNDNNPINELQNLNSVLTIGNNAGNHRIVNVAYPVSNSDVATKYYVDTHKGIISETDPQVGSTTYGKWCIGTGSQVSCDQDVPSSYTYVKQFECLKGDTPIAYKQEEATCDGTAPCYINDHGLTICPTPFDDGPTICTTGSTNWQSFKSNRFSCRYESNPNNDKFGYKWETCYSTPYVLCKANYN